ncbi:transposase [Celerinatantimonas sp. YJH-8]|uniref:transposase n=1 Tax=Celerinatantimonas sp. YJH-8 TaxID=3228714 RepID=UPI0038C80539
MPKPRCQQISLSDTPYYHCISRCVRRAFLCGEDSVTGKSFEHRCGWIEERLLFLGGVFAIDICAYAIMSNHLHVVLHVNESQAESWSTQEVIQHWHQLHQGTCFTRQFEQGESLPEFAMNLVNASAETYRARLQDISWLMRELNEPIARQANAEDNCTGRFWEGRFKSQALLDETALAACMAYVDLNPLRAGLSSTPEDSEFTSFRQRAKAAQQHRQPKRLYPFTGNPRQNRPEGLAFKLTDYLELIDLTGRIVRPDKKGSIDISLHPILQRLHISSASWLDIITSFSAQSKGLVGSHESLVQYDYRHHCRRHHRGGYQPSASHA